ncbi:MAG: MaoC family dehydratase [Candidatus Ancillula sp.]|jgi:3-hydroxybutyryl-CoA dehydratase|nr:MaoC family dehydratase [Candidatus Ancillula sp.]
MNSLEYAEIEVGQTASFMTQITEEKMARFSIITGDISSIHLDDDWAKQQGFNSRISYGMLTSSYISTLSGMHLPGKNSVLLSESANFLSPVYPGDFLTITGEVVEKTDALKVVKVKVVVKNQHDKKVMRGSYLAKIMSRKDKEQKI